MIKINETIVVEGTYDIIKLNEAADAHIVSTNGFDIINNEEKLTFLKTLAKKNGIVIFTDSDKAGFRIRNYLKGSIKEGRVLHAYAPEIAGRERRKQKPSKEGLLGVEGMKADVILRALENAGCVMSNGGATAPKGRSVTKLDLYEDGFIGKPDSTEKRRALAKEFSLPRRISSNALIAALNAVTDFDGYKKIVGKILKMSE